MEERNFLYKKEINLLKMIALIMVLFQHSLTAFPELSHYFFSKIPYSTNSFVFLYISGYLYGLNREKYLIQGKFNFLKKKFFQLVIPYFFCGMMIYFVVFILSYIPKISTILSSNGYKRVNLLRYFFDLFKCRFEYVEHFWYLYHLFLIFLLCALINFSDIKKIGLILFCGLYLGFSFLNHFVFLNSILLNLLLFCYGQYEGENHVFYLKRQTVIISSFCFIFSFFDFHYLGLVDITICRQIEKLILLWSSICLCKVIACILKKYSYIVLFSEWLKIRSFSIYLLHNPYFVALTAVLCIKLLFPKYITIILSVIIGIIGPSIVYKIASNNKLLSILITGKK